MKFDFKQKEIYLYLSWKIITKSLNIFILNMHEKSMKNTRYDFNKFCKQSCLKYDLFETG